MRVLGTAAAFLAAAFLCGCAATKEEVAQNLGSRFVGKSPDALVREFGPPASTFRMASGETAYSWQLAATTAIDGGRYSAVAKTYHCKVNVITNPAGIITRLTTEDATGVDGGPLGIDFQGSVCAQRLGMPRQT
jgi:hypothetical protein